MQKKQILFLMLAATSCHLAAENAPVDSVLPANRLEEVIVSATRAGIGNGLTSENISSEQMQNANNGVNLPFLLSMTPSLVATSDDGLGIGYTYFRIRGTDHTRINTTVNGVPLNDAESQTVFWVNLTDMAASTADVLVERGVGTSTNGAAAFGASVNMLTGMVVATPYAEITFNGGMYGTFREMAKIGTGLLNNGFAFDARFSKVNSSGYLERAKSDLYSYSASGGYYGANTMVKLLIFGGKEKTYMAWDGVDSITMATNRRYNPAGRYLDDNGNEAFYKNQTDNYQQQHTQLLLSHIFSSAWNMTATAHYTRGNGYYEQYKADAKFADYALLNYTNDAMATVKRSDLVRQKHLDNHFFGGTVSANHTTNNLLLSMGGAVNRYLGAHFGRALWLRNYPLPVDNEHEYYRSDARKSDATVYTKLNWNITPHWMLYGDAQYRYIDYRIDGINDEDLLPFSLHKSFHFFNPKAGITYQKNGHTVYAKFAVANREPSRSNYTESGSNNHPLPEQLYDYEAGYMFRHSRWSAAVNLYFMDYKNQLVLTGQYSDVGAYLTKNVKDSYRTGIELIAGVQIAKWLRWDGNVTFSRNKIINFTDWVDDWYADWDDPQVAAHDGQVEVNYGLTDIAFSPNITAGSLFSFNIKQFNAALQTNVVGRQYLDNTMSARAMLKAYCINNLTASYTVPLKKGVKELVLKAQINNLFDTKYISNGGTYSYFEGADASGVFSKKNQKQMPWYYPQAGINAHAGFTVVF
ncbi:MAG: TonB-dependent receptor [Prevotellaceae bacterium]|jgi:iron complex outermembrane receptor protein|nr:TonB-dependent receptor [Prevotellaceae bacterium]